MYRGSDPGLGNGMTWYALQHKPAQGDRAVQHLQNQDVACFYPKIEVERVKGGKRAKRLEPLFPGYVFVNLEQTNPMWAKLRSTRGGDSGGEFCQQAGGDCG